MVGVVADLGGKVEGDAEPADSLLEEVAKAAVRLGGGREARGTAASSMLDLGTCPAGRRG